MKGGRAKERIRTAEGGGGGEGVSDDENVEECRTACLRSLFAGLCLWMYR